MNPPFARMRLGVLVFLAVAFGAGCITTQALPATQVDCLVVDDETNAPLAGARVTLVWRSSTSLTARFGPFITDAQGRARVETSRGQARSTFGGHLPAIVVEADGYESISQGLMVPGRPHIPAALTIHMNEVRNRYGAVRVVGTEEFNGYDVTSFELLDGPRSGTILRVPTFTVQRQQMRTGEQFYLTRSLETLEADLKRKFHSEFHGEFAVGGFLRSAPPGQPYAPTRSAAPDPGSD